VISVTVAVSTSVSGSPARQATKSDEVMLGKIWRTLLVIGLGLGLTWAAGQTGSGPPSMLQLDEAPAPGPASTGAATGKPATGGAVEELSSAEIEAELKNVEKVLSGGPDPGEAVAEKPLPADLGVALPSDI
jgi:hypothetical protein